LILHKKDGIGYSGNMPLHREYESLTHPAKVRWEEGEEF